MNTPQRQCEHMYLPDLCGMRTVLTLVVVTELFVFVLALGPLGGSGEDRWSRLGLMSLFVQWITLFSSSLLCLVRRHLCRLRAPAVTAVSFAIILGVTVLFSELTYWLYYRVIYHHALPWHLEFLARNLLIAAIVSGLVLRYFYVQQQWKRNLRAESESRMQALQARIRPHFLFNSMNTIISLIGAAPERAERVVEDLSDLFRASLGDGRKLIPVEEELALCRRYLEIESLRLGDRLAISWALESLPESAVIPPLTLQPLIENAIYHGIEPRTDGGEVAIGARVEGRQVVLTVRNPLAAAGEEASRNARRQGNQIALANIRERLAVHFGEGRHLRTREQDGHFEVTLALPVTPPQEQDTP
ncbi:MAG TPA: sensor histidine kinase [Gammaproteobacteria bacterium]|nr:sensor histidine kinase [Gammaproteobacteria bacterium]